MLKENSAIDQLIGQFEREQATAKTQAHDFHRRAAEFESKVAELDIVLNHLRAKRMEDSEGRGTIMTNAPSVRAAVRHAVSNLGEFRPDQLVSAVQSQYPDMKSGTILAELSQLKTDGIVENPIRGIWKRVLHHNGQPNPNETQTLEEAITQT